MWVNATNMNVGRWLFTMNNVGSHILVMGGQSNNSSLSTLNSLELFDGETWQERPFNVSFAFSYHCAVTISETEVVIIGGFLTLGQVVIEKYDIFNGLVQTNFSSFPDSTYIYGHACTLFEGEIIVAGGFPSLKKVYALDLTTLSWRSLPDLNYDHYQHTMEVVNGQLIVFGGILSSDTTELGYLERYDGNTWIAESLNYTHVYHASVVVPCQ